MFRWSIRKRIFALVVTFTTVFVSLFHYFWLPTITNIMVETEIREIERQMDVLIDGLTPFILSNQFAGIDETLRSIETRYANWYDVSLVRADGRKLYPLYGASEAPEILSEYLMPLEKDVLLRGDLWGTLSATIDLSASVGALQSEVRAMGSYALAGILVLFLVAGFFSGQERNPPTGLACHGGRRTGTGELRG